MYACLQLYMNLNACYSESSNLSRKRNMKIPLKIFSKRGETSKIVVFDFCCLQKYRSFYFLSHLSVKKSLEKNLKLFPLDSGI